MLLVAAGGGDKVGVVFVVDICTLGAELFREGAACAVVARHEVALGKEVAFQGTHADAAGTDEIY